MWKVEFKYTFQNLLSILLTALSAYLLIYRMRVGYAKVKLRFIIHIKLPFYFDVHCAHDTSGIKNTSSFCHTRSPLPVWKYKKKKPRRV